MQVIKHMLLGVNYHRLGATVANLIEAEEFTNAQPVGSLFMNTPQTRRQKKKKAEMPGIRVKLLPQGPKCRVKGLGPRGFIVNPTPKVCVLALDLPLMPQIPKLHNPEG